MENNKKEKKWRRNRKENKQKKKKEQKKKEAKEVEEFVYLGLSSFSMLFKAKKCFYIVRTFKR